MTLAEITAVIADMDGVLWRGDQPLPGLPALFDCLNQRGLPFVLATNNSSKSPADYTRKLAKMNVPGIAESTILTSGTATAAYLRERYPAGTPIHILGGDGLRHVMREAGFVLADDDAAIVVAGLDQQLSYEKLRHAATLIREGALFVGTNADKTFPMPDGLAPGAGSIIAALAAATDQEPLIVGKPHAPMFETALELLGQPADKTLMIGDRLDTDILGAARVGLRTALVFTGITTPADLNGSGPQPDMVFADLPALIEAWQYES